MYIKISSTYVVSRLHHKKMYFPRCCFYISSKKKLFLFAETVSEMNFFFYLSSKMNDLLMKCYDKCYWMLKLRKRLFSLDTKLSIVFYFNVKWIQIYFVTVTGICIVHIYVLEQGSFLASAPEFVYKMRWIEFRQCSSTGDQF